MELELFKFKYKSNILVGILLFIAFGAFGGLMVYEAISNTDPVTFLRRIHLGAGTAKFVFVSLSLFFIGFALSILSVLYRSVFTKRFIYLYDEHLEAPKSIFFSKTAEVKYGEILSCSIRKLAGKKILDVKHPKGTLSISEAVLDKKEDFNNLCSLIAKEIKNG